MTKSSLVAKDVTALLRARNPLLWIVTREEARVEGHLFEAAMSAGYTPRTWDVAQGVAAMDGKPMSNIGSREPRDTLDAIRDQAIGRGSAVSDRGAWILRDMPAWLEGLPGATLRRQIRNLARLLPTVPRDRAQAMIVISADGNVPPDIAAHATVIDWPLPDREEITGILDAAIEVLPDDPLCKNCGKPVELGAEENEGWIHATANGCTDPTFGPSLRETAAPNGTREAAIDAAVGLSGEEAQACYARSLVQLRKIDPATVANEKKRVIARERVLEWFDPLPGGLDAVGGLDNLKAWLVTRKLAYTKEARAYGLPAPKGCLLGGVPGCGKSLTAKAVATAWGNPLLRFDPGGLRSKFVGESESNLRKTLSVVEAIGRCVLWIDEIEKALAGATQGAADGGVSADLLGTLLTWMEERKGEAFVIATANDVTMLPPELMRRFDERWFIDLPGEQERIEIVGTALVTHGRKDRVAFNDDPDAVNPRKIAAATEGFTGSEIAALVPDALYMAFADNAREITTQDLLRAARAITPLSVTAPDRIAKIREWGSRARPASRTEAQATTTRAAGRAIDL